MLKNILAVRAHVALHICWCVLQYFFTIETGKKAHICTERNVMILFTNLISKDNILMNILPAFSTVNSRRHLFVNHI